MYMNERIRVTSYSICRHTCKDDDDVFSDFDWDTISTFP